MKNRLNLYSDKYAPTFSLLSLNSLSAAIVFSIVLFAIASALLAWRSSYLDSQVSQLRSRVNNLQSEIDNAQQLLANRQPDQQLVDAIENQKLELSQRQKLLQELSMREKTKNNRFSQVLADLDKADMPTVWLTTIHMSNEKIQLEGFGTRADAMPSWLANLSETSSFSGTDFQQASMVKEEKGLFFSLQTDLSQRGGQ
jgi:Tfp pilus assembly protein PilN